MRFLNKAYLARCHACLVVVALLICAAWSGHGARVSAQTAAALLVIVAAGTSGADIEIGTLRQAYGGYSAIYNGTRLIPFNQAVGTPARALFDRIVLDLSPDQVGAYWVDRKIRNGGQPPRTLPLANLVVRVVASLPGAIGYIEMDPRALPSTVRVLTIAGKRPEDPDYPLRNR